MVSKQPTQCGAVAKEESYFKHKPNTRHERFMKAYCYFSKKGKTKKQ